MRLWSDYFSRKFNSESNNGKLLFDFKKTRKFEQDRLDFQDTMLKCRSNTQFLREALVFFCEILFLVFQA